uniref:NADH-ubiquinone oxidoreductase chain 2 n=1 Tax=Pimelocerus perforatus TaxID=1585529 RepID=A0A7S6TBP3_9CUCU|nr:NADH dehydrogenase subunit 2 [Pimelocerus perforatus]QOU11162.1 NADH dehydrogenase subunit 2 [Pimelocerus perforatus]
MKNFYKLLFFSTMISGTLISISTLSWLTSWIGLEINLLSLMPLMKKSNNKYPSEATIKYFITQAMASSILLFSIIIFTNMKNYSMEMNMTTSLMVDTSLLFKVGAAPLHFWFPEVMSGLNWEMAYIMMTWQKIAPMVLLTYTTYAPMFLSIIIIISSLISGIQGMNYVCLRKIMAYSSINHVSWMISALLNSNSIWFYYFLIYCMINFNIVIIFLRFNIYFMNQVNMLFSFNKNLKFMFMLNFLSLGGLPPFLGFFPKWLTINHMILNNFYILSIILIIFTLLSLYIYLRITFSTFTLNSEESMTKIYKKTSYLLFFSNSLSLTGLMMCLISINIF